MHKPRLFRGLQVGVVPRLEGLGALWGLLGRAVKYFTTERDQSLWSEHTGHVPSRCMACWSGLTATHTLLPTWHGGVQTESQRTVVKCRTMEEFQFFEILAFVSLLFTLQTKHYDYIIITPVIDLQRPIDQCQK